MNRWAWLGLALIAFLFWGLDEVIVTPLETGEAYPPYSSLRRDPLGAKALYDSLSSVIPVDRLYKERMKLTDEALLILGVDPVAWSALDAETIQRYRKLVENGGRLVIGFLPVRTPPHIPDSRPVEALWGIQFKYRDQPDEEERDSIPRETSLYFASGPHWRSRDGFVERDFGAGTVVLIADTFPLSNQGLREERNAPLIAAVIGPARRAVFDENHFGVVETGSIVKLMRKYRLEGALAILAIVAGLFLWRSGSSLLPPRRVVLDGAVAGRDSLSGMAALLYRGVAERDLMSVCFAEWSKTERNGAKTARVEEEIRGKDAVTAYRAACRALSEKLR